MKKLSVIFAIIPFFFLISCAEDEDDIAVGNPCSVEGEEACSANGSEILACWNELWQTKKKCNTNSGEYCHETADGKLSCKDIESNTDTGDTSPDTSDSDTDTADSDTDTADSDTDTSDTDTDTSNPDTDTSNPDTDTSNPDTDTSDSDTDTADSDTDTADPDTDTSDSDTDTADPDTDTSDPDTDTSDSDTDTADPDTDTSDTGITDDDITDEDNDDIDDSDIITPNPCDPNPCSEIANTNNDHTCDAIDATTYKCGCKDYYFWNGESCTINNIGRICTEQNKCYNATAELECPASASGSGTSYNFFGQDAQYAEQAICLQQSFTVETASNEEIYIVDNNTGLEWTHTVWQEKFSDAKTKCNDLNYAGKTSGWRLPTPQELLTLVDNSTPEIHAAFTNMPADGNILWSVDRGSSNYAITFKLPYGIVESSTPGSNKYYFMCVRGETMPAGTERFTIKSVNNQDVVIDSATGLMWQKKPIPTAKKWQISLEYCETGEGSDYAGYTDWRMPDKNELASLLDHTKSTTPYTNFPGITSTSNQFYWTSTTYGINSKNSWAINFSNYTVNGSYAKTSAIPKVICVRNAE